MLQLNSVKPLSCEWNKALLLAKRTSVRFEPPKHLVKGSFLLFHDIFMTWIVPSNGKSLTKLVTRIINHRLGLTMWHIGVYFNLVLDFPLLKRLTASL